MRLLVMETLCQRERSSLSFDLPSTHNSPDRVRVCIASSWYPHIDNPYFCIFVHEFAKRIHRAGVRVFVFTIHGKADREVENNNGIPVLRIRLNRFFIFPNLFKLLIFFKAFKRADIVHVHAIDLFGSISALLAKFMRKPVVITVHRADVLPSDSLIFRLLRTIVLRSVDRVIAVSNATRNLALSCGAPNNKVVVVYNAVDESIFHPRSKTLCRLKLNIPQNSKVILSVGNLIPRKGFSYLIRAFPIILTKIPNAILIIIGDGPQRDELIRIVKNLKLEDKVIFTGRITTDDLCSYYGAADVFVLPSLHEGHAVVLLEAMSSGLPVVATNIGGNLETVSDGKNGYLVEPKNVDQLADAVVKILSNEKRTHEYGNASLRIYKEKFSEEKQIRKIFEIYSTVNEKRV